MKRIFVLVMLLGLVSLACLNTNRPTPYVEKTVTASPQPLATRTSTPAPTATEQPTGAVIVLQCVRVIAETAENLRSAPGVDGPIVGHLLSGEVWQLISDVDPDWWLVASGARGGYARSIYLEKVECVP